MPKWEYCNRASPNFQDSDFNKLGDEGWELVTIVIMSVKTSPFQPQAAMMPVWVFKRQKPEVLS